MKLASLYRSLSLVRDILDRNGSALTALHALVTILLALDRLFGE